MVIPTTRLGRAILAAVLLFSACQDASADLFYTAYRNGGVSRVDELTGRVKATLAPTTAYRQGFDDFRGVAIGPDGLLYVSARYYDDSRFGRWGVFRIDPDSGDFLGSFINDGPMEHIEFGPDGDLYAVYSWSDDLLRYDGVTGEFKSQILRGDDFGYFGVGRFAIAPDGAVFATTSANNVAPYDPETGDQIGALTSLPDLGLEGFRFDDMAVGPDGLVYAAYNYRGRDQVLDGGVIRIDAASGEYVDTLISDVPAFGAASGGSLGVAFGPNGDLYVGSQHASAVLRYDPSTGELLGSLPLQGNVTGASHLAFLPIPAPGAAGLAYVALLLAAGRRRR